MGSNKILTTQIKLLTETNAQMLKKLGNRGGQQVSGHQEGGKRISSYKGKMNPQVYCWYQGYKV